MDTKWRNIKYKSSTKIIMYTLAFITVMVAVLSYTTVARKYNFPLSAISPIELFDKTQGTDFYEVSRNAIYSIESNLDTVEEFEMIINDQKQTPAHDLLGINMDNFIDNRGIRYYIYYGDRKIIGYDGVSSLNVDNRYQTNDTYMERYVQIRQPIVDMSEETAENLKNYLMIDDSDDSRYYIDYSIGVFYDEGFAYQVTENYNNIESEMLNYYYIIGGMFCLFLAFLVYFLQVAGKTSYDSDIKFNMVDKIYLDIILVGVISIILIDILFSVIIIENGLVVTDVQYVLLVLFTSFIITVASIFAVSNVGKRLKTNTFLPSISAVAILNFIWKKTKNILKTLFIDTERNLKVYVVATLVLGLVVKAYIFDLDLIDIVFVAFYLFLIYNFTKIVKAIKTLSDGKTYTYEENEATILFANTFENLEKISSNSDKVYNEGVKAQRVKTEIITNVSHDLRTPLTSITGYIDLLYKKMDNYDDETKEYISIIRDKSDRINTMVSDLFDLAKLTSGDVQVEREVLNVKKLVEQTISELEDSFENKGKLCLDINEDLNIFADGNKMFRVMQNLLDNGLKYSLDGTRIYIDSYIDKEDKVCIEVKNIANYKMTFSSDEIVERFTRGDNSRTTDGSGLGLSIAETNTHLNNGEFFVIIDGDMFKVLMKFDRVK